MDCAHIAALQFSCVLASKMVAKLKPLVLLN